MHMGQDHLVGGQPINAGDTAVCPVMNIEVSKRTAAEHGLIRIQDGETHYLCCEECANSFSESEKPKQRIKGNE